MVVKKEWANFPSGDAGYNGSLFIVDMTNIERRPLRDRDTKLLTNRQNPGDDRVRRRVPDGGGRGPSPRRRRTGS